ncbi:hypothetical protein [Bosea minatitlanensis]|uniref:Uncharacterized protein n=1 Tax=Bosea minatitlanensis TaxID=128782 RepID=A0ABW0F6R0_9HYPH|nr:hypothetical protein [Bosea minatitlanensis]MCT4493301.1 hypothetical protein [Bosea minatitlanensis]
MHRFTIAAFIVLGGLAAAPAAYAGEALAPSLAQGLDRQPAAYAMTAAKRERLMIIQENMARQRYYGHRYGYRGGYGYGYGYGRPPGYPPYGPAYGYRRHYYDHW